MKRIATALVIVIVVAGVAIGAYFHFAARPAAAATTNLSTATVKRGTLIATVNAAGNVAAAQDVALNFGQAGTVQKVDVQVGDQVKAGQVLAELDTANLALQLQNAQVNLKVAQDKLTQTKTPSTSEALATARAQVQSAQSGIVGAQAAYKAAVQTSGSSNSQLASLAASLDKARATLQQAQAAYDKVAYRPDVGQLAQSLTLQSATDDYNVAKANYDALAATTNTDSASKVATAKTQLQQAQSQLTQAQDNLNTLSTGPDAATLDIAQSAVDQAQIAEKQAELNLKYAQVVAPFDGVVTAVNITPGQSTSTGGQAAIEVADLSHLEIVVNLAETDVNRVRVGQDAQITLDALPNATLQGKVTQIAPAGVITQGVVNYPVTIQLTDASRGVKTGMTSNLNIVVQQRDNVLIVPNRAVRAAAPGSAANLAAGAGATTNPITTTHTTTNTVAGATPTTGSARGQNGSQGGQRSGAGGAQNGSQNGGFGGTGRRPTRQQFVTVLRDGQQVQVPVQTGVANDTMTEIVSGLNEGDVVVLTTTTTAQPRTVGGGIGIPGVGGFGRGG
jgi:HlyD family secretion protein